MVAASGMAGIVAFRPPVIVVIAYVVAIDIAWAVVVVSRSNVADIYPSIIGKIAAAWAGKKAVIPFIAVVVADSPAIITRSVPMIAAGVVGGFGAIGAHMAVAVAIEMIRLAALARIVGNSEMTYKMLIPGAVAGGVDIHAIAVVGHGAIGLVVIHRVADAVLVETRSRRMITLLLACLADKAWDAVQVAAIGFASARA